MSNPSRIIMGMIGTAQINGIYFLNTRQGRVLWNNKVNRPQFWGRCEGCGCINGPYLAVTEATVSSKCHSCPNHNMSGVNHKKDGKILNLLAS